MAFNSTAKSAMEKIKQGPVQIVWDQAGTPVEMFCKDGARVNIIRNKEPIETDLVGVYDLISQGEQCRVTFKCDEMSQDAWAVILADQVGNATTYIGIGRSAGHSSRGDAKSIRIRPWQDRAAATLQFEGFLMVPTEDFEAALQGSEPWNGEASFDSLPDLSKADGELHGKWTLVARS